METTLVAATTQNIIRDIETLTKAEAAHVLIIKQWAFGEGTVTVVGEEYDRYGDHLPRAYVAARVLLASQRDTMSSEIKSFLPQLLGKLQPVTAQNCPLLHPVKTQLESFSQTTTTTAGNHGQFHEILKQLPHDWHVQLADCI